MKQKTLAQRVSEIEIENQVTDTDKTPESTGPTRDISLILGLILLTVLVMVLVNLLPTFYPD